MPSSQRASYYWILAAACLSALSLAIVGSIARIAAHPERPEVWADRLLSIEERAAGRLIRQAGHSIPEGIPKLVQVLLCDRPYLSITARNVLLALLDEWQLETTRDSSLFIGQLAEELARHSEQMDTMAHRQATYLVERILRSQIDDRVLDPEQLVANCEKVLRARIDYHRIASARLDGIIELPSEQTLRRPLVLESTAEIPADHNASNVTPIHEDQFVLPGGAISVVPGRLSAH